MLHLLRAGLILVPVAVGNSAAWGQGIDAEEPGVCTITAMVTGKYPEDRYVRAEPEADSPLLALLEGSYRIGNDRFYPEVEVTGSQNGWFRISEAMTNIYIIETPVRVLFEGEGWIHGSALDLWVESPQLFSGPSLDAPVAVQFSSAGMDFFAVERLLACQGYWVEAEGTYAGETVRGWTSDTCASQVTTCP